MVILGNIVMCFVNMHFAKRQNEHLVEYAFWQVLFFFVYS